jgi:hypothetical protein
MRTEQLKIAQARVKDLISRLTRARPRLESRVQAGRSGVGPGRPQQGLCNIMPDFLLYEWLTKPLWLWFSFMAIVIVLLALDLGVLHRRAREIEVKESLILSAGYIFLGVAFSGFVWWAFDNERAIASPRRRRPCCRASRRPSST